ncbi:MAG: tRNA (adenosine(37)-N6)-threonylcarbamoyltransferase complex ATPase subunit type 1 TsaE [Xanthobacteraceae bacterium]|nr:tRNA (adenosine(37)-N6)-threonylcarbamoyltransferase complex ATPase subunit type 1 TsaE [Xanthobacteraceae bacterium]
MATLPITSGGSSYNVALESEQAIGRLVMDIAASLDPGDLVTLSGDLGAGKTTFARALIRFLADNPDIPVPSPTFTLMQTYDLPRFPVVHADLYRLEGSGELAELGFDDLPKNAVVLLEWPDRAAGFLPPDRLDIAFTLSPLAGPEHRNVRVTGYGTFAARAERIPVIRRFLDATSFAEAHRRRIQGDASTRSYERLTLGTHSAILMNAARRPDGPPVRDGKPYSQIAHLAEDVVPFVAMANGLRQLGFSAPQIYEAEIADGLLLIEDLGAEPVVTGDPPAPIHERYAAAVDVLITLHDQKVPAGVRVAPNVAHRLPAYDMDAQLIEAELLLDWYLPHHRVAVTEEMRATYANLWHEALQAVMDSKATWVLRDYHSPNLIWLPERKGVAQVGLLDFQDAVIGPAAYDLASLLQDARVDVPELLEVELLGNYVKQRAAGDPEFEPANFIRVYATVAAQRASKILGIFARLNRRDGKPQYLRHIPRVWGYLQRSLAHPSLVALKDWYTEHVPVPQAPPQPAEPVRGGAAPQPARQD